MASNQSKGQGSKAIAMAFAKGAAEHMESIMGRNPYPKHENLMGIDTPTSRDESFVRHNNRRFAHGGVIPMRSPVEEQMLQHQLDALRYSLGGFVIKLTDEEVKQLNKEVEKMEDTVPCRNWDFKVPHIDAVCPKEVTKHVSRVNPVAIMCYTNSMVAFVHASIMHKAQVLEDQPWEFNRTSDPSIYAITSNRVSYHDIINWARHIKGAPWGDHKRPDEVRVIIPKI
ncbi:MAG: hypothetical protein DRQ46_03785 [Gammaproteobacteria bacterium]|nr:MAG: hypothetical protein DRQ46_03785 [Gammaproteobacteria bacterium]